MPWPIETSGSPFTHQFADAAVAELILLDKVDASILRRDAETLLKSIREAGLLE